MERKNLIDQLLVVVRDQFLRLKEGVGEWWRYVYVKAYLNEQNREIDKLPVRDRNENEYVEFRSSQLYSLEVELNHSESKKILKLCKSYGVIVPSLEEKEELYTKVEWDLDENEPHYLNQKGFEYIRPMLDEALRKRRELWAFRVAAGVGLIGAVTGLFSVMS